MERVDRHHERRHRLSGDQQPASSRGQHLHVLVLCLLHHLRQLLHTQSLSGSHHRQVQRTEEQGNIIFIFLSMQYSCQKMVSIPYIPMPKCLIFFDEQTN